jgi:hypothetical protein
VVLGAQAIGARVVTGSNQVPHDRAIQLGHGEVASHKVV